MIQLLSPRDPRYPTIFAARSSDPAPLWVSEDVDLNALTRRSIAVIGSRASTAYGDHVAGEIATVCANAGITVVTGGAYGIDGAANRAALTAGGPTFAVLACGVNVVYPAGHASLFQQMPLVSPFGPGVRPTRERFLFRNGATVGLAHAVILVEAATRSGSIAAARIALQHRIPVYVVPGPITSAMSAGPNHLLNTPGVLALTDVTHVTKLA